MVSSSSGSNSPPVADVQPHQYDEKPWGLFSSWHMSSSGEAEPPSLLRWTRQCQRVQCRRQGWASEPGEPPGAGFCATRWCPETKKKCSTVRPNHTLASLVHLVFW